MCEWGTSVDLQPPAWWNWHRPTIAIDACIVDALQALWDRGVVTLGSCCGHGRQRPNLVLNEDPVMPEKARVALTEVDLIRRWELLQWRLCDVTTAPSGDDPTYKEWTL
jgi:hypothetical protein